MKLLGVRFRNFARFDECFIPLNEGVHLLVGRNNAGKTALLRGLTALSALQLPGVPSADATSSVDRNLGDYCRREPDGGDPEFGLDVLFAIDAGDSKVVDKVLRLPPVRDAMSYVLEYNFRVLCANPRVAFQTAHLLHDSQRLALTEGGQEILYDPNAKAVGRQPLAHDFFFSLTNLQSVRIVDAHRVVKPQGLQQQNFLSTGAETLAPFLDNLRGDDRDTFDQIEKFVVSVFPEFRYVNTRKQQGTTALVTLTKADSEQQILLSHCGTGVEQILALATFIFTSPPGSLMLLDEPHSYLHPIAERALVRLIQRHDKHRYVISTHSAILMNSVTPDRIVSLTSNKITRESTKEQSALPEILHSLGYQNSDLLFSDRLVFVEGDTEQNVLPQLLAIGGEFKSADIDRTGFPSMGGKGRLGGKRQTSLIHYEALLARLGNGSLPRLYLFDGDCTPDDRKTLGKTAYVKEQSGVSIKFLPRHEIENYLLVPEAIAVAVRALGKIEGKEIVVDAEKVKDAIDKFLASGTEKLFPNGPGDDPRKTVKASRLLEELFGSYELSYQKRNAGRLIAQAITVDNQDELKEIWDLVRALFPSPEPKMQYHMGPRIAAADRER